MVMLKVSPWKGVIRFAKRDKLSPQYVGPFKIIDRIGLVAYKLELPDELRGIHNTFHVYNLKRCLADKNLIIPLKEIQLDDKLHFIEEPVEIMDREVKQLKQSRIPIAKVRRQVRNKNTLIKRCLEVFLALLKTRLTSDLIALTEKCHFMVKEGIVLGHKVSEASLKVDKAKINVISKHPPPTNVKGIRCFLGHAGFYRRFIKDFLKIARPLTKMLEKDTPFECNDECHNAFDSLKEKLTCNPVIVSPNWNLPFELMCDASEFEVGAVLGQKDGKHFHSIYFASKTLNVAQQKYTITEKELMDVQDAKPCLIRWILLLQEFDIEIKDKKGTDNVAADHLSRIENDETSDDSDVDDNFPGETRMEITTRDIPWFIDFVNYLNPIFSKYGQKGGSDVVSQDQKLVPFYINVTTDLPVDIMDQPPQLKKS
ncbi:reverse transcriptase domain-containing protein [Tanacetum coccineum]